MQKKKFLPIAALLLGTILTVILGIYAYSHGYIEKLNLSAFRDYINSYGNFAELAYVVLFSLKPLLLFIPCNVLTVLAGGMFGPVYGFLYTMLALFISATLAFYIARVANKSFVKKILGNRFSFGHLDSTLEKHGFKITLILRMSFIFPYDILSYFAGLTKVTYRSFIWGSILGAAPETFSLCAFGANMHKPMSYGFWVSVGMVLLTVVVPLVVKKVRKSDPTA